MLHAGQALAALPGRVVPGRRLVPAVARPTTYLAERSIRPLVIMRKISGGSRSAEGTKTRLTLASLLHTWAARNLNPFVECLTALQQPVATAPP